VSVNITGGAAATHRLTTIGKVPAPSVRMMQVVPYVNTATTPNNYRTYLFACSHRRRSGRSQRNKRARLAISRSSHPSKGLLPLGEVVRPKGQARVLMGETQGNQLMPSIPKKRRSRSLWW